MARGQGIVIGALVAVLVGAAAGSYAAEPTNAGGAPRHHTPEDALISADSPDSLATAAALKQYAADTDNGGYRLASRASQLEPKRADLAWLAVRLCASADDCDESVPEKRFRQIDPDNAAGHLGALRRAQARNDDATVDAELVAIGSSEYFNVYYTSLAAATASSLLKAQRITATDAGRAASSAKDIAGVTARMMGIIASSVLPPTQFMTYACQGAVLQQIPERREHCQKAALAVARADTFVGEGLGLSLAKKLWPEDSPEGRNIAARRLTVQYRLEEYSKLNISSQNPDDFPPDMMEVMRTHPREQDAALVYFARAGVAAEPPADWVSKQPPRFP